MSGSEGDHRTADVWGVDEVVGSQVHVTESAGAFILVGNRLAANGAFHLHVVSKKHVLLQNMADFYTF